MNERELHRLSRKAILEIMLEQSKAMEELRAECEGLRKELEEARAALKSREIDINEAGSIAVAALKVNGIFEIAQVAGQQYLENIKRLSERQEAVCAQMEAESRERSRAMLEETEEKCRKLEAEAQQKADKYWDEVYRRLQLYFEDHQELKKLLSFGER